MREFTDSAGIKWTVFEVRRHGAGAEGKWSYLPAGFGDGWLCFESRTAGKRRLTRYPERWRQLPDEELEALCAKAVAPRRRASIDLPETATDTDIGAT